MTDFFVSYTGKDQAWAEWIAWQLQQSGRSVLLQAWHFHAGGEMGPRLKSDNSCPI